MCEIALRFTTPDGDYPGAYFADYFRDNGLERAREHDDPVVAHHILINTYLGPDVDGVGVTWKVA